MNMPIVSKDLLRKMKAAPNKRHPVRTVDGVSWDVWVNRWGTVRLTRTVNQVILKPQGATGEGAGPENQP